MLTLPAFCRKGNLPPLISMATGYMIVIWVFICLYYAFLPLDVTKSYTLGPLSNSFNNLENPD